MLVDAAAGESQESDFRAKVQRAEVKKGEVKGIFDTEAERTKRLAHVEEQQKSELLIEDADDWQSIEEEEVEEAEAEAETELAPPEPFPPKVSD